MYKALNYWVFGGFEGVRTPFEMIDFGAETGLDGVELTVGDALKRGITEKECREIRQYADSRKIGLRTLATGFYWTTSLASACGKERAEAIEFTKEYLHIASWIGAETILVIPGATRVAWDESRPVMSYREVWENSALSLREVLPLAEKLQVNIALENVWNRFLLSPMEWKMYLDQFRHPRLGMYLDAGNCCYIGRAQDYVEILSGRVKALHLKNFTETDCCGGLHGFGDDLLSGHVDFRALFEALGKINYQGPVTVEMIPFSRLPDLVLPDEALARDSVRKLLSL